MSALIDMDAIEQLKELMGEKFPHLVETYTRNADKHILNIVQGYAEGDAQRIVDSAHPLKSSSGNMGLVKLSELAAQIEATAKTVVAGEQELSVLKEHSEEIAGLYENSKQALMDV